MDAESTLLLFDEQHPCWTHAMLEFLGYDAGALDALFREGLLQKDVLPKNEEVYSLTSEGTRRFRQTAEESFFPVRPGVPMVSTDKKQEADRSFLQLLLDRRHLQRWGLKEYCKPFRFEIPDLKEEALFTCDKQILEWRYLKDPVFIKMAQDFPVLGLKARRQPVPDMARLGEWMALNVPRRRMMEVDLLYKSRYDFQSYAHFPKLPGDPCDLLNADRFFCSFAPLPAAENLNGLLTMLAEYHLLLTMLRHMFMPGYVDLDSLDQDGINWFLYTYEREEDARECAELLSRFGSSLAGPAAPLEIWSLSLQALRECGADRCEMRETIHDLLPFVAHPILRI